MHFCLFSGVFVSKRHIVCMATDVLHYGQVREQGRKTGRPGKADVSHCFVCCLKISWLASCAERNACFFTPLPAVHLSNHFFFIFIASLPLSQTYKRGNVFSFTIHKHTQTCANTPRQRHMYAYVSRKDLNYTTETHKEQNG